MKRRLFDVRKEFLRKFLIFTRGYETPQYNVNGFAVTNLALKATKALNFNERFSLPIFVQAIWNPRMEDAHLVFGVTLKP